MKKLLLTTAALAMLAQEAVPPDVARMQKAAQAAVR